MTRDRIYAAELAHDTSGASDREVEACMGEAMDSIVDDLMSGQKVSGMTLTGFLEDAVLHEELAAAVTTGDFGLLKEKIAADIRDWFADSDAVHDRAAAIANERGGDSE